MKVLVTGWAGFIGSNLVRYLLDETDWEIVGMDSHSYASRPLWVYEHVQKSKTRQNRFVETKGDIRRMRDCVDAIAWADPDVIIHLAAESHVCRSIADPTVFVDTNVMGTFNMLQAAREHRVKGASKKDIIFHHVSTDEVFGELGDTGAFSESTPYAPRSPYAASKASSDHLVMAFHYSYGMNTRITNCSNNFGANQHDEKLIPKSILKAFRGEPVTIYGPGTQVRDWIWVDDHCRGIHAAIVKGTSGGRYLLGGECERSNLDIVSAVWSAISEVAEEDGFPYLKLNHVMTNDRPTDDKRYAIDTARSRASLAWRPFPEFFHTRLKATVRWYRKYESQLV